MGIDEHETLDYHEAGIQNVLASLARQYITDHTTTRNGRKFYEGELHVLRWYQEYDHKKKETQAKQEGGTTTITNGV